MLEEKLNTTIHSKCRGMLTNGVVLHHDNVQLHIAAVNTETIRKLEVKLLPHPAYSPDLSPCCINANLQTVKRSRHGAYMVSYTTKNILCKWHQETHGPK
jgi:hypothetical protein